MWFLPPLQARHGLSEKEIFRDLFWKKYWSLNKGLCFVFLCFNFSTVYRMISLLWTLEPKRTEVNVHLLDPTSVPC